MTSTCWGNIIKIVTEKITSIARMVNKESFMGKSFSIIGEL